MFYEGCTYEEIEAFRELENEEFDFGEGPMRMEGLLGSEDVYYKMALQSFRESKMEKDYEDFINYREDRNINEIEYSKRNVNLANKRKQKRKLKRLNEEGHWSIVVDMETHLARVYRGQRSKYIKKRSNKKVRKSKNLTSGNDYRKAFNFWYELW